MTSWVLRYFSFCMFLFFVVLKRRKMHPEVSCTYSTHTHYIYVIYMHVYWHIFIFIPGRAHLVGSSIIFYPWRLFLNSPECLGHHHARQELVTAPSANSLLQYGNPREREEEGEVKWFPWGKGSQDSLKPSFYMIIVSIEESYSLWCRTRYILRS